MGRGPPLTERERVIRVLKGDAKPHKIMGQAPLLSEWEARCYGVQTPSVPKLHEE
ncbi:hypothetical protein F443_23058 [Phytophthora nicotianae P1569]|uniref:Uncharacterized protein n=1 Tax=Phytophthora nicotianae P1569 TaxID=1317065 RepID=V9DSG3_PHYNI|nr:hypothetical protein F443_23058 [Phytophthora nicotianae P1569]